MNLRILNEPSLRYPSDNRLVTYVSIIDDDKDNYTIMSSVLEGDLTRETDQKLIELVLEDNFKRYFKEKANEERITTLIQELDSMRESNQTMQLAMMEMVEMVTQSMIPPVGEPKTEDNDNEIEVEPLPQDQVIEDDKQTETDVDDSDSEKGGD